MAPKRRGFKVASRACGQCLFGPNKIVSDERKDEVLEECENEDTYFVCHKSTIRDPNEGMCCRGFYEAHPGTGQMLRIAERLGAVVFADPDTGELVQS